jgi:hypothetical protein
MKKVVFTLLIIMVLLSFGCVVIPITEELENPFIITISWNGDMLELDPDTGELPIQILDEKGAVVQATVNDEYGNLVIPEIYEWYLKGILIEDGDDTIYLDNTLQIGTYWLDLIVGKGAILSSEQVDFIVVK